ncbi:hypothetical protein [Natrarchaeobius chitinivorans]|uniref:Uncharacterized protein n=1 Tax=Natrarchaeobius chitinivorans TaxID=1679083 RepID=A0A3N6P2F8_NATCH|nr:hypothetical protein [Natrarchaeobius chitinivorans]RQG89355.1 hypothetical protein EA473_22380 [Natrarchaeobius chitinivorans]
MFFTTNAAPDYWHDGSEWVSVPGNGDGSWSLTADGALEPTDGQPVTVEKAYTETVPDEASAIPNRNWVDRQIASTPDVIDGFESGTVAEYDGDLGSFDVNSDDPVSGGHFSLKLLPDADVADRIVSTTGLNAYPPRGSTILADVEMVNVDQNVRPGLIFGAEGLENHYTARYQGQASEIQIGIREGGTWDVLDSASIDLSSGRHTWRVDFDDPTIRFELRNLVGDVEGIVEVDDETFEGHGVGYYIGSSISYTNAVFHRIRRLSQKLDTDYDGGGGAR